MNPLRRLLKPTLALGSLALCALGLGQTQGYVQRTRTIRAGVLLTDADKPNGYAFGQTATPFAFYNLDQATGVKPSGWTFINPYAPGQVTQEVYDRYYEVRTDPANLVPPTLYQPVRKQNGAYWTVSLSTLGDTQLANYDVLLLAPKNALSLNSVEREKLRRFVDGGGILWVEAAQAPAFDDKNTLPFAFARTNPGAGGTFRDGTSPLLNGLRQVSDSDLYLINYGLAYAMASPLAPPAAPFNDAALSGEYRRYRGAAYTNGLPTIAQARLGDGQIVVTTGGAAIKLNEATVQASAIPNAGYTAREPGLNAQGRAAARLAINIVGLAGGYRQADEGSRKNRSDASDTPAPVLPRFMVEGAYGPNDSLPGGAVTTQPVVYKGYLVASINGRIAVFDPVPGRDLDGDGDPDDGIDDGTGNAPLSYRDVSVGKPMDLVWYSGVIDANGISGPTCAEVPDMNPNVFPAPTTVDAADYRDQILVTDSQGRVHIFLLKATKNARLIGGQHPEVAYSPIAPPQIANSGVEPASYNASEGMGINSPTVYDSIAYMADTTDPTGLVGRVWAIDLTAGKELRTYQGTGNPQLPWVVGGPGAGGTGQPAFTAAPTIGYIPSSDGSGGVERVLYAPGVSNSNNYQPTIVSLWLGSKGERPFSATVDPNTNVLSLTTRAGSQSQIPIYFPQKDQDPAGVSPAKVQMAPRLSILDANGNPINVSTFVTPTPIDASPGVINFQWNAGIDYQTQFLDRGYSFRIDYSIDWGADPATYSAAIERGRLLLPIKRTPLPADTTQRIRGSIALTPRGTLHVVEGPLNPNSPGGSYFAIRENGGKKGLFNVVSRFVLYGKHNEVFNNVSTQVDPVLADGDDVIKSFVSGFPFYQNDLSGFRFGGGVAVRNGIVYATINANHGFIPVAIVAALKAEPETPEIRLGSEMGTAPRLQQVDFTRNNASLPASPVYSTITSSQMTVDTERGILRLENLATVQAGEITDCINLSGPVGVGWQSRPTQIRQPDALNDRWTPILWYGMWTGGTAVGGPLVAGDEVYLAANSVLPNILKGNGLVPSGVVWAIDADVPTSGLFTKANLTRPWLVQALQLNPTSDPTNFASPYYRMPQNKGTTGFTDWALRLDQTRMGNSTAALGIAGGEGTVTAFGNGGLYGLSRADFVVCDEGRVLRVDSSGNPISSAFGGRFSGVGNGSTSSTFKPLVRPVKAYPVGDNDFLVVDAGANRVVRLDEDGTELRSIDRIKLDEKYKPAAYRANEPLTLNDPRDATTYEGYVFKSITGDIVSNQLAVEYWVRTIIADSGNGRIVELADRYNVDGSGRIGAPITYPEFDPTTGGQLSTPQVGVLVWQSPSLEQSTKLGDYYNSIGRVFVGSISTGRYVYVAGVSRTRPTRSTVGLDNPGAVQRPNGSGGGAIVVFDPLGGTRVFDRFGLADTTNTAYLSDPATGTFAPTTASRPAQNDRPFTNLQSVSASTVVSNGQVSIRLMAADQDAVYEFAIDSNTLGNSAVDPTQTGTGSLQPTWYINEAAFTALRASNSYGTNARLFRPAYARRLDSGDILIVNGYRGVTRGGAEYKGEVMLLDSTGFSWTAQNLGFKLGSVHFDVSTLSGTRDLVSPVFADRK